MKRHITRIIFAIFCAAIVLLPLLPRAEAEGEYTYAGDMAFLRTSIDDRQLLYFYNSEGVVAEMSTPRREDYWIDFSLTRDSALVIPYLHFDNGGTLYYVDREGASAIADDVYCAVSADCKIGAYITNHRDRSTGQLHYYRDGESICIEPQLCTRLNFGLYVSPTISPDGKTVAYCRSLENGGMVGMLYHKGKFIELGKDIIPIAVSNDMEYLYYAKLSVPAEETTVETLQPLTGYYVRHGKDDILIGEGKYAYFLFNRDFSEAIVTADGFNAISVEGGGRLQQFSGFYPVGVIAPQSGLAADLSFGFIPGYYTSYTRVGVDSFIGKVLHSEWGGFAHDVCMGSRCQYHNTAYLDSQLQFHIITDSSYAFQAAEEGSAALYKLDEELYFIPDVNNYDPAETVRISKYCKNFTGNADFSTVYYTNTADTLYSCADGELTMLAQDVQFIYPVYEPSPSVYAPGLPSPRFNGSIYFRKNADFSLWRISPEGAIEQLSTAPEGASLCALDDELLFKVSTDGGIEFYRFDGSFAYSLTIATDD